MSSPATTTDLRRITEDDPDYQRLHQQTVARLTRSLRQYIREEQQGIQGADSRFVQRHTDIMLQAYEAAHHEGQRDYWPAVSNRTVQHRYIAPAKATTHTRMAWYALPSANKLVLDVKHYVQQQKSGTLEEQEYGQTIELYNPNHDAKGRFDFGAGSSGGGSTATAAHSAVAQGIGGNMGKLVPVGGVPKVTDAAAEARIIATAKEALAGNGVQFHTDAITLGGQVHDYIDQRLDGLAQHANEAYDIIGSGHALTPSQEAWVNGDNSQHDGLGFHEAQALYAIQSRAETVRLLGEVRGTGGVELNIEHDAESNTRAEQALKDAQYVMPRDWLEASNAQGALYAGKMDRAEEGAGYYLTAKNSGDAVIATRMARNYTPEQLYDTAVHEFTHRSEDSVNGLSGLERQFYNARTASESAVQLRNGISDQTRLDRFADEYLGRVPHTITRDSSFTDASGRALRSFTSYELLSNGVQWTLGTDYQGSYLLSRDPEFHHFVLGSLFGAKNIP